MESPEIVDDFEIGQDEVMDIKDKEVNKQKLKRRIKQYKVSNLLSNISHGIKQLQLLLNHYLICL